jgi:hypothetical protein
MSGDRAVIILAMTMPIRVYSVFLPEVRSADFRADVNIGNAEEWPRDCSVHNGLAFSWGKCEPPAECRSCSWIVAAQTRVGRRPPAAAAGSVPAGCRRRSAGPLSGRRCALAGYVAASIMEWPGLACDDAILKTLRTITDFYRVKLSGGTAGARDKIQTIERAINRVRGRQDDPRQDRSSPSRPSTTALSSLANQSAIGR